MAGHVAVIDPAIRVPELDCFNRMSRSAPIRLTYHLPALYGMDSLLRDEEDLCGLVVLGSGASVHDRSAWQLALGEWLRLRVDGALPTLGLCFGHQLLVHLFGGTIAELFGGEKRLGLKTVHLDADPLWGDPREVDVLVSHREGVVRLPEALECVGRSEEVRVEAFRHRSLPTWGFQFHAEATPAFARNNGVPFDGPPSRLTPAHTLVDRFLARCG